MSNIVTLAAPRNTPKTASIFQREFIFAKIHFTASNSARVNPSFSIPSHNTGGNEHRKVSFVVESLASVERSSSITRARPWSNLSQCSKIRLLRNHELPLHALCIALQSLTYSTPRFIPHHTQLEMEYRFINST